MIDFPRIFVQLKLPVPVFCGNPENTDEENYDICKAHYTGDVAKFPTLEQCVIIDATLKSKDESTRQVETTEHNFVKTIIAKAKNNETFTALEIQRILRFIVLRLLKNLVR